VDNSEIKLILSAFPPHPEETLDPTLKEAWQKAQQDPELKKWLEEQQHFDRIICDKLKCCTVPPDLKASILAGSKVSSSSQRFQRYGFWALAACLLLIIGVSISLQSNISARPTMENFRDAITQEAETMIRQGIKLDFQSSEPRHVYQWIHDQKMVQTELFNPSTITAQTFGCKALAWRGHKVAMVCFRGPENQMAHLFIIDRSLISVPERNCKEITTTTALPTASWFDQNHVYVLVGNDSNVRVVDFL
jgi:hypothetical protein